MSRSLKDMNRFTGHINILSKRGYCKTLKVCILFAYVAAAVLYTVKECFRQDMSVALNHTNSAVINSANVGIMMAMMKQTYHYKIAL